MASAARPGTGFGGLDLAGELIDLENDLERFLLPLFAESGIEEDFMRDRTTDADRAQTRDLRQDVARWLREAADQMRTMDRVQWTPYHISHLTELIRNARDSAEPIPSYREPLDEAIRCLEVLASGASYSSELTDPIRTAVKNILADVNSEDHSQE